MSYNGSGTYIPPAGQPVATGTVIQSSSFNTLVTDIGNTFNNVLPRDGQASMAGQLKLTDGTSSVPGIAFNSEASTGIFRPSAGLMAFGVSGVENVRLSSSGRVLIGTTTDDGTNKLQVNGATKISGAFAVTGAATVTGAVSAASFSGPLTGAVTGNVTGNVSGSVTGNVTGNVTGTSANVTGVVALVNGGTGATTAVAALTALGAAPIASPTFTGTVTGSFSGSLTGNVTGNASGTAANVTGIVAVANGGTGSATATGALANLGAAPTANPTFTGTVSGVTATMVGLGNVTNTSDANKPVSTAQQTALNLKAPLASPAFTGGASLSSGTGSNAYLEIAGNGNVVGSTSMLFGQDTSSTGYVWNRANSAVVLATNNTERARLTPGGNLLLGTTTDDGVGKLQVNGLITVADQGTVGARVQVKNTGGTFYMGLDNSSGGLGGPYTANLWHSGAYALVLATSNVERARISAGGNVLIGTAADNATDKLQVTGSAKATGLITGGGGAFNGTNVPSSGVSMEILHDGTAGVVQSYSRTAGAYKALGVYALSIAFGTGVSAAEAMRIPASGNLLVGTNTDGGSKLQVNGEASVGSLRNYATGLWQFNNFSGSSTEFVQRSGGGMNFYIGSTALAMQLTAAGVIQDAAGNELGYKDAVQNIQGGASYTLAIGDRGKSVVLNTASAAVTVPTGVFVGGAVITIYNNSGSPQTIVQGTSLTLKFGTGASPLTGNRTLANNGICTLYYVNTNLVVVSGSGVS